MLGTAFLAFCAFLIGFQVLVAFIRGTKKSLFRLITVLIAAVAAYILANMTSSILANVVMPQIQGALSGQEEVLSILQDGAMAADAMLVMVSMLISPLLFLAYFVVIKFVLVIPYGLLLLMLRIFHHKKKKKKFISRLVAIPLGICSALISILVLTVPVMGYLDIADTVLTALEAEVEGETEKARFESMRAEYVAPIRQTPVASTVYDVLGRHLFKGLTNGRWQENEVQLDTELPLVLDAAGQITLLGSAPMEQYGDTQCHAVEVLATDITTSPMMCTLSSGILNKVADKWQHHEKFMGVDAPNAGDNGNLLLTAFFEVFSTSTTENIGQDLEFFSKVFQSAVRHGLLSQFVTGTGEADLTTALISTGFYGEVQALLGEYPRMEPVRKAISDIAMRALLKELGVPEDLKESHNQLMQDMTGALQNTPVKEDGSLDNVRLAEDLTVVMAQNSVAANQATVQMVADTIAQNFTAEEIKTMTTDEIMDKLVERFGNVDVSGLQALQQAQ